MKKLLNKILGSALLVTTLLAVKNPDVLAEIYIANGQMFICENQEIVAVKDDSTVLVSKALRRFNKIIARANQTLSTASVGTATFNKARKQKRNAVQGRKDVRDCLEGELKSVVGSWNLVTENGSTPPELGFESLTIAFTINTFESTFTGTTLTCDWTGTYTKSGDGSSLDIRTRTGEGGTTCEEAIDQTRTATFELSEDGNTLTLDYRPSGTLQVFERVS